METKQSASPWGDYESDRAWSDQFITEIKRIVGPYLLEEASIEVDQKQATDLIVLMAKDMRIACRVRRPGYLNQYPWEFTVRAKRNNGAKTEMRKIVEGFGDWLFYAHAHPDYSARFAQWFLIDLDAFRAHMILSRDEIKMGKKDNGDGTCFRYFDIRSFPSDPPLLIALATDTGINHQ